MENITPEYVMEARGENSVCGNVTIFLTVRQANGCTVPELNPSLIHNLTAALFLKPKLYEN